MNKGMINRLGLTAAIALIFYGGFHLTALVITMALLQLMLWVDSMVVRGLKTIGPDFDKAELNNILLRHTAHPDDSFEKKLNELRVETVIRKMTEPK